MLVHLLITDLFQIYGSRKQSKRLFYQQLTMKVDEFENKRQFKCVFVSPSLKEEEIVLYPNWNDSVANLLEECRKKVLFFFHVFNAAFGILFSPMLTCFLVIN